MTSPRTAAATSAAPPRHPPVFTGQPVLNAICLDIDDTLIDFTASAMAALDGMLDGAGTGAEAWALWQRLTDEHVPLAVSGELDYAGMRCARTKAFFADLGRDLADAEVAALEQRRLTAMNQAWTLFDDALPCLQWLRAAGLPMAAVTNASGSHQRTKLADTGLTRYFDVVLIAGELGVGKPDPVIFHTACAELGSTPDTTAHVGDRLDLDAHAARDAGLHAVWLDRTARPSGPGEPHPPQADGVLTVSSLADLPELLVSEYAIGHASTPSPVPAPRR